MNATITQETILLYIYRELPEDEMNRVEAFIESNADARQYYQECLHTLEVMGEAKSDPDPTSVKIILEESHTENPELI